MCKYCLYTSLNLKFILIHFFAHTVQVDLIPPHPFLYLCLESTHCPVLSLHSISSVGLIALCMCPDHTWASTHWLYSNSLSPTFAYKLPKVRCFVYLELYLQNLGSAWHRMDMQLFWRWGRGKKEKWERKYN